MNLSPLAAGVLAGVIALLAGWRLSQRVVPSRRMTDVTSVADVTGVVDVTGVADTADVTGERDRPARASIGRSRTLRRRFRGRPPITGDDMGIRRERGTRRHALPPLRPRSTRVVAARASHRRRRRSSPIEQDLADWCVAVARSVRSGVSLSEAVAGACGDVPALTKTFAPVMSAQRRGASLGAALNEVRSSDDSVALVVAVTRTCARLGGPAAEPLDRAAAVMHARLAAQEERKVHSAQAQLSAMVLTVIPLAVLALLLAIDGTVRSAFGLTATWVCVGIGLLLNLVGWRWMRRIIRDNGSPKPMRPWRRGPTPAQRALPDGIELLVCCLHAGLTPPQLLDAIATDVPAPLRPAFGAVQHRVQRGHRFADALEELPTTIGHDAHSLADSIASADRYGLPLAPVLERLAAEAVAARRRHDEIAARKLPIRLSFPLVVTVLPAFVLVALAPAVIGALSTLSIP